MRKAVFIYSDCLIIFLQYESQSTTLYIITKTLPKFSKSDVSFRFALSYYLYALYKTGASLPFSVLHSIWSCKTQSMHSIDQCFVVHVPVYIE